MKFSKVAIAAMLIMQAANPVFARKVTMVDGKSNGKRVPDTYRDVKEPIPNERLDCRNKGENSCCWQNGDDPVIHVGGTTLTLAEVTADVQVLMADQIPSGYVAGDVPGTYYSWGIVNGETELTIQGE